MILSNYGNIEFLQIPAISANCTGELAVIDSLNQAQASQGVKYVAWCEMHYIERRPQ